MRKLLNTSLFAFSFLALSAQAYPGLSRGSAPTSAHAAAPSDPFDWEAIQRALATEGVVGEIHAINAAEKLYVFTIRHPQNFFVYVHVSLVAGNPGVDALLATLGRHDRVRIKGERLDVRTPQPHVEVSELEVLRKYVPNPSAPPYSHEVDLPGELVNMNEALFLVHAVHGEGRILVVEYKDAVLPVAVTRPELTAQLFRNDVVRLKFRIARTPGQPTHLRLLEDQADPVTVVESAVAKHGQPADVTGTLVLFPKSPQVTLDVWAVAEAAQGGAQRQYTLINFDSMEVFHAILAKCAAAWAKSPNDYVNGRNKLLHKTIKIRARGVFNVVDPNQANVQIFLNSADDLEIVAE